MPLRRAYAPMLPQFDTFLFASVGEEVDGAPLSVLSALSRLGLDPRDEAARLSHLTKELSLDFTSLLRVNRRQKQPGTATPSHAA